MGMDLFVPRDASLDRVLTRLAEAGLPSTVMMVDNQLHAPNAPVPPGWRDVRLRTPAGMLSLKRQGGGIAIVVFGNADAALQAAQQTVADILKET